MLGLKNGLKKPGSHCTYRKRPSSLEPPSLCVVSRFNLLPLGSHDSIVFGVYSASDLSVGNLCWSSTFSGWTLAVSFCPTQ